MRLKKIQMKRYIIVAILAPFLAFCSCTKKTEEPYKVLTGHKHKINSVAFSKDSRYLISSSWDNTVRIWDMDNFSTKQILIGHNDNVWDCTISSDNKYIASASLDNSFIIWDFETGKQLFRYEIEPDSIINKGIIPELDSKFPNSVYDVDFSPDNRFIALGSADHLVRIFDLSNFELIETLDLHDGWVLEVRFSEDGKYLVSGGFKSEIIIWETEFFTPIQILKDKDGDNGTFIFTDNNSKLLTPGDSVINIWDIKTGEIIDSISAPHAFQGLQLTKDGEYVVTSAEDHTVRIWHIKSGKVIWTYYNPKPEIGGFRISPDGIYLAVATPESNILIWRIEDLLKKDRNEN